jgi:predicted TIM-barrel fold metal-dependent hydrolase
MVRIDTRQHLIDSARLRCDWAAVMAALRRNFRLEGYGAASESCGIIAYASGDVTAETLRPFVEHMIECFGWNRVLWGRDWPVCNLKRDLGTWGTLLDEILAGCPDHEHSRLYQLGARAVFRI